jgi:outer membrane protein OmpA-like peptidoglycan-associated protein
MLDQDDGARVGVWVTLGIITLLLFGLIFGLVWRQASHKAGAKPKAAMTAAAPVASNAAADAVLDVPLSGDIIGKVYFDLAHADLPASQMESLGAALQAAGTDNTDRKLMLSGFHDASGDPAKNAELAKERAKSVREALKARGVPADRIVLRKPEQILGDGPPEEARRVEIRLVTLP